MPEILVSIDKMYLKVNRNLIACEAWWIRKWFPLLKGETGSNPAEGTSLSFLQSTVLILKNKKKDAFYLNMGIH